MASATLDDFIGVNRDELIRRCRVKVAARSTPPPTEAEMEHGIPLFLDQLVEELRHGPSQTREIADGALLHGREMLRRGFTVGQVVHDYGDVCQSVTDLAVELAAPISTDDFRTLNRCLDDAIAGAVTQYAKDQEISRDGRSHELWNLTNIAITAFQVLQSGSVGVTGTTGTLIHRSLLGIRALLEHHVADSADPQGSMNSRSRPPSPSSPW